VLLDEFEPGELDEKDENGTHFRDGRLAGTA
jgi:hypothetical protein